PRLFLRLAAQPQGCLGETLFVAVGGSETAHDAPMRLKRKPIRYHTDRNSPTDKSIGGGVNQQPGLKPMLIEQALFGRESSQAHQFLARSPGFGDEWLEEAERLCIGFGERP